MSFVINIHPILPFIKDARENQGGGEMMNDLLIRYNFGLIDNEQFHSY